MFTMRVVRLFCCACLFACSVQAKTVSFSVNLADSQGNAVTEVQVDEVVTLSLLVEDIRDVPRGVFSAFADVEYTPSLVELVPTSLVHGSSFGFASDADLSIAGLIDDVGSLQGGQPFGVPNSTLFTVDFVATSVGVADFVVGAADLLPTHATTVLGNQNAIPESEMEFVNATLLVVPEPAGLFGLLLASLFALRFMRRKRH